LNSGLLWWTRPNLAHLSAAMPSRVSLCTHWPSKFRNVLVGSSYCPHVQGSTGPIACPSPSTHSAPGSTQLSDCLCAAVSPPLSFKRPDRRKRVCRVTLVHLARTASSVISAATSPLLALEHVRAILVLSSLTRILQAPIAKKQNTPHSMALQAAIVCHACLSLCVFNCLLFGCRMPDW